MANSRDLYETLEVSRDASSEEIRKAHRRLAREYHPDANPGDGLAEEHFKEVQRAYDILSDPGKRREYDQRIHRESGAKSSGRAAGEEATPGEYVSERDVSELLRRLSELAGAGQNASGEKRYTLSGRDLARLAELLGLDVSHVSRIAGEDVARLSRLLGERLRAGTRVASGSRDRRAGSNDADDSRRKDARGRKSGGTRGSKRRKRVRGPKARRREAE